MARAAGLCLAAAAMGAPAALPEPLDRATLTGRLVPITGEAARSVDLTVPFARGSATLTAAARRQLDELGAALAGAALRGFEVGVHGHTDASGPASYNLKLSAARAAAAAAYLIERFALDPARFRHAGYGEERLLAGLDPNSPRHRRVEIVVFAPEGAGSDHAGNGDGEDEKNGDGSDGSGLQAIQ